MLKADFFDNVFLQQDAFDAVDAAVPARRQRFMFGKVEAVVDCDFGFQSKDEARKTMVAATDLFRNLNYAAEDGPDYAAILGRIDAFIAQKGRTQ